MKEKSRLFLFTFLSTIAAPAFSTDFMGLNIGDPFLMPECKWEGSGHLSSYSPIYDQPIRPCWQHEILKGKPGDPISSQNVFKTGFVPAAEKSPRGIDTSQISLIIMEGKIEGIQAPTNGYKSQDYLSDLLINKYGEPTTSKNQSGQNLAGATINRRLMSWHLADCELSFMGIGSSVKFGFIQILSPSAQRYLENDANREKDRSPSF